MTFETGTLEASLAGLEAVAGKPSRYVVAFSGGLDSTVLLHALESLSDRHAAPIIAIHVDHGLQDDADAWNRHCETAARDIGVAYRCLPVTVQPESGRGPEASAREARYSALHGELRAGDWLLSAHHREDQAETLLLNLVRGSGPAGIAGIGAIRRFGPGWLARPLLDVERAALKSYADARGLQWVEDPSNQDRRFDRNFLRHEILPRLKARWPDVAARLHRSARHASEASELLAELAAIDLEALGGRPQRLPIDRLMQLSAARQRNLIRYALRCLGLGTPTALKLERVLDELIPAREDAQPLVAWPGASVRRYRNGLYLLPETLDAAPGATRLSDSRLPLGPGLGVLELVADAERGLSESICRQGLTVSFRRGGEQIRPDGHAHTRKLKKLLQEEGIVPWMRDRLPLVYAGEQLVAVADLWMAADAVAEPGVAIRWAGRPALH